ncbi:hypothetical protein SRABI133_01677 [Peribacillus simplex]|uniref:Uncharacterized protein n=1 Tax=Peribacillus simplex TaxID=1478 RepID=A0A9W4KU19_9BACI|nr:hypothetical protein SRABI133_01677 [Peribacillus simplex]
MFYLKGKTKLIGAGVRDSCGKSASRGDPAGESRGGSPTARGKRVPYVPINVQIVQAIKIDKLDFHRVCLQSETTYIVVSFICSKININL